MKPYIKEEIEVLTHNLNVVTDKLRSGVLSTAGAVAAQELAKTLTRVKEFISSSNSNESKVHLIITKLPLLYFQIPKLN